MRSVMEMSVLMKTDTKRVCVPRVLEARGERTEGGGGNARVKWESVGETAVARRSAQSYGARAVPVRVRAQTGR